MLTDSHCHLDRLNLDHYQGDLAQALAAARARGVERFLCIGIDRSNCSQVIEITENNSNVFASVGLHPLEFNQSPSPEIDDIESWLTELARHPKVIGIGETGLDYYYSVDWQENQLKSFEKHLKVAKRLQKPVIVHSRDARQDTLALIREHGCPQVGGVLHCFTENWEMAKAGIDLNYYISFSGIITFKNAAALREVVKKVPMERILVETDSPYLAPVPFRGKANEPKNVVEVAKCVAEIKDVSYEQVCQQSNQNFDTLFGLQ